VAQSARSDLSGDDRAFPFDDDDEPEGLLMDLEFGGSRPSAFQV
jgi:hypothetical protein